MFTTISIHPIKHVDKSRCSKKMLCQVVGITKKRELKNLASPPPMTFKTNKLKPRSSTITGYKK